jgi:hypothetical protein
MACSLPQPQFASVYNIGIKEAIPLKDGYTVYLRWTDAVASSPSYTLGYNVYYSSERDYVFQEGAKYFTLYKDLYIGRFVPGDTIYCAIRATEYDPNDLDLLSLPASPQATNAYIYPETALMSDIDDTTLTIPLIDTAEFPSIGVIKIGTELLDYSNVDYFNSVIYANTRGFYGTNIRFHNVDGYDGYHYEDPIVRYFSGFEDLNTFIAEVQPRIEPDEYPFTQFDGYKQVTVDILTTDLSSSDEEAATLPSYDHSGYHQTSMVDYFSGKCLGSYHGGEYGCADGYKVRGLSLQTQNNQRQELLLAVTGEPVVLLKRLWTGIRCNCFRLNQEHHEGRCSLCFSTSFVGGYEQFYNDKRSDGKIMIRFGPAADDLAIRQQGLEQNFVPNCWGLVYPAIKDRDVLIRFNQDLGEEFRYEVVNVTRNKLSFSLSGAQQMTVYRLDKTDPIYQWRAIRDTSKFPYKINTSLGILRNYGPHLHTIVLNENVFSINDINQTTSVMAGHNHPIINGIVQEVLGHTHDIIL